MSEEFLRKVFAYAEKEHLFVSKQIKQLDKTCCHGEEVEVIDFDYAKLQISISQKNSRTR